MAVHVFEAINISIHSENCIDGPVIILLQILENYVMVNY